MAILIEAHKKAGVDTGIYYWIGLGVMQCIIAVWHTSYPCAFGFLARDRPCPSHSSWCGHRHMFTTEPASFTSFLHLTQAYLNNQICIWCVIPTSEKQANQINSTAWHTSSYPCIPRSMMDVATCIHGSHMLPVTSVETIRIRAVKHVLHQYAKVFI